MKMPLAALALATITAAAVVPALPASASVTPATPSYSCVNSVTGHFIARVYHSTKRTGSGVVHQFTAASDGGAITMIKVLSPAGAVIDSRARGTITLSAAKAKANPVIRVQARIKKGSPTSPVPDCVTPLIALR